MLLTNLMNELVVLLAGFALLVFFTKKSWTIQPVISKLVFIGLYPSSFGMRWMKSTGKNFSRTIKFFGKIGVYVGFLGMIAVIANIGWAVWQLVLGGNSAGVSLVLPVQAQGVLYVPLTHWLIALVFIMLIHEGAHGIVSEAIGVRVKKTGLAFLNIIIPLIPAAFVEPDEQSLTKKPKKHQLAVFAAGPTANILAGSFFLMLTLVFTPLAETTLYQNNGVTITQLMEGEVPARAARITPGETITLINTNSIKTTNDFSNAFTNLKPGDSVRLVTSAATYTIPLSKNAQGKPLLGVFVEQSRSLMQDLPKYRLLAWIIDLVRWLALLNIGVGLFNLLPIGPIDGGRMMNTLLTTVVPSRARIIHTTVSMLLLVTLVITFVNGFF